jgi:hypothetical protein
MKRTEEEINRTQSYTEYTQSLTEKKMFIALRAGRTTVGAKRLKNSSQ